MAAGGISGGAYRGDDLTGLDDLTGGHGHGLRAVVGSLVGAAVDDDPVAPATFDTGAQHHTGPRGADGAAGRCDVDAVVQLGVAADRVDAVAEGRVIGPLVGQTPFSPLAGRVTRIGSTNWRPQLRRRPARQVGVLDGLVRGGLEGGLLVCAQAVNDQLSAGHLAVVLGSQLN